MSITLLRWGALVLLSCISAATLAQKPAGLPGNYPAKPVRVIIGSSPGGGTDIIARMALVRLGERWNHTFVIENHGSGIGGIIGMDMVARAPGDGYTLLVTANSTVVNAALVNKTSYDVRKGFVPVVQLTSQPYVLAAAMDLPVQNVKEMVAYVLARPDKFNYASSGTGSAAHIGMEQFKHVTGMKVQHIPYKGIGPGLTDMVGGRIQLLFGSVLAVMPHAKNAKVRALAVGSLKRSQLLPDIPTIAETVPGFEMTGWYGILAPAGTPMAAVNALNQDINLILAQPEARQKLAADGAESPQASPAQFAATMNDEIEKIARLVKETGLQLQ